MLFCSLIFLFSKPKFIMPEFFSDFVFLYLVLSSSTNMMTPLALALVRRCSTILSKSSVLALRRIFSELAMQIPADVASSMKDAMPCEQTHPFLVPPRKQISSCEEWVSGFQLSPQQWRAKSVDCEIASAGQTQSATASPSLCHSQGHKTRAQDATREIVTMFLLKFLSSAVS